MDSFLEDQSSPSENEAARQIESEEQAPEDKLEPPNDGATIPPPSASPASDTRLDPGMAFTLAGPPDDIVPFPDYEPPNHRDFPFQVLPELLKGALLELCRNQGVSVLIAFHALATAVSIAGQDLFLVDTGGERQLVTCSLNLLLAAESGAGKTRADRAAMVAIVAHDKKSKAKFEVQTAAYLRRQDALNDELQALRNSLKKLIDKLHRAPEKEAAQAGAQVESIKRKIEALRIQASKESAPRLRKLLYQNVSIPDLERDLCQNWPAAGLVSNEAADILCVRGIADMARLDRLWDGQPINVSGRDRKDCFSVDSPCLTVSQMTQLRGLDIFLDGKGEAAKDNGFLARTLTTRLDGSDDQGQIDDLLVKSTIWLDKFSQRTTLLLELGDVEFEQRIQNRRVLKLTPAARSTLIRTHNARNKECGKGGRYEDDRDFVKRFYEHASRLVGLFYPYKNRIANFTGLVNPSSSSGLEIDEDLVHAGIAVTDWYLKERRKLLNREAAMAEIAGHVFEKLTERILAKNGGTLPHFVTNSQDNIRIPVNDLRNFCTKHGLRKNLELYNLALDFLVEAKKVMIMRGQRTGSPRATSFVLLILETKRNEPDFNWRRKGLDNF